MRRTPFASLTPAPPTIYFVPLSRNSYLAGPSPCPCPGVDTPPQYLPSSFLKYNKIAIPLKIREENISLFFDGYPSQKELLDRLSENENFKAMIRQLKPWGDNTLLIRVMTLSDSANGVLAEIPLKIVYKEDFK